MPIVSAGSRRCVRPERPGCTAEASMSVPTTAPGLGRSVYAVPSTVAVPALAGTRPVITRIVVVLPAPFGPRKPVTVPGSRAKDTSSTTVRLPYCLVSPLTLIISGPPGFVLMSRTNLPIRPGSPRRPDGQNARPRRSRPRHPKVDPGDPLAGDPRGPVREIRSPHGNPGALLARAAHAQHLVRGVRRADRH